MPAEARALHVSLVAIPEAVISTLSGVYDVLNSFQMLASVADSLPAVPPFAVEILGERPGPVTLAGGLPITTHRTIAEVQRTDILIVPSLLLPREGWAPGRYPALTEWVERMHGQGAVLCSACSGIFLLAETGLFDGRDSTVHWAYATPFRKLYPAVPLEPERALVVAGERGQYVSSGASTSWHDLVLYLIARNVGATAAQTIARFFALQWHHEGLAPYVIFEAPAGHGDAVVEAAQAWAAVNFSVGSPVEAMARAAGLPESSFKRRFAKATGYAPLAYVQRLRIEEAKRRLERTEAPIDEIGWRVGYEDPAFFRRLFKRTVGLTPGAYRRRFQVPVYGAALADARTQLAGGLAPQGAAVTVRP